MADDPIQAIEKQLRAALAAHDPDPAFVRRLEAQLLGRLPARPRRPNWRAVARAAAALLVVLALAGAAAWAVRYLRPSGPGGIPRPAAVPPLQPTETPRPAAASATVAPTAGGTPLPSTPTPPGLPDLQPDFRFAGSTLSFNWDGGEAAALEGPFRGELLADGRLLGRVDFGPYRAGWCDRSWDGQVLAYTYGSELRFFRLPALEQVYTPFGVNSPTESATLSLLSPLTFAPADYRVAFYGCSAAGSCGLYVYALDTGALQRFSNHHFWLPPVWSPDGQQLTVQLPQDENSGLRELTVRVYRSADGVLLYEGPPQGIDSPILAWGVEPVFEFDGQPRCAEPVGK